MTTLSDRYVWAVLRAVPQSQRIGLEPEIRALVADAVEATTHAGASVDPATAERAALVKLGDPEQLAATYAGRRLGLIGSGLFPTWRRLVLTLLAVVVPIIAIVTLGANLLDGASIGETVVGVATSAYLAAVMVAFWVTVVFAVIEWTGGTASIPELTWTPERLPSVPGVERLSGAELIGATAASIFLAAFLLWQELRPPIVDGTAMAIIDPALWSFWMPYFLVVIGLQVGFGLVVYLRGRWTYPLAAVHAALSLALTIPALWLLWTGQLFNPALIETLDQMTGNAWLQPTVIVIALSIGGVVAWDAIDTLVKARRNAHLVGRPSAA